MPTPAFPSFEAYYAPTGMVVCFLGRVREDCVITSCANVERGWMACEHLNASGGGRKMSLDIPFNRTWSR